ncbi:MAG: response regulator [Thermodesulfobacteriota bacterium]
MNRSKILIADDESRMLDSLRLLLADQGWEIETAASGAEAVVRLRESRPDLILLDMFLGDLDGFEIMDQLRRISPDTMVIIITGKASLESAVGALRQGAYSYLKKPFESEDLINTVKNALARKKLEAEQKRTVKALKESEERFRRLVENSPLGILIVQNHQVVYQNPEAKDMLRAPAPALSLTDLGCLSAEDRMTVQEAYDSLLSGKKKSVAVEFRLSPAGGHSRADRRWFQCRAGAFLHQGREAILVNLIDVTRAKELEQFFLLKSKMISLGRVAAGMAHEIRNPLTGINSYIYTLKEQTETDRPEDMDLDLLREIAVNIQAASNKIETVIKRVLDFARPGRPKLAPVDLNQTLQAAVGLSAAGLRKHGVRVITNLSSSLPLCRADGSLIEQVAVNLIQNAVQMLAGTQGERIIEVASSVSGSRAAIIVSDSGPGVPLELREDIFDPFFTTRNDGSGIGLSLVQRIVTDHGGTIRVGKGQWGGAEFLVELPVDPESQAS